jgi:hypothetical protein
VHDRASFGGPIPTEDQENTEIILKNSKKIMRKVPKHSTKAITPSNLLEPGLSSPRFENLGVIIREA